MLPIGMYYNRFRGQNVHFVVQTGLVAQPATVGATRGVGRSAGFVHVKEFIYALIFSRLAVVVLRI